MSAWGRSGSLDHRQAHYIRGSEPQTPQTRGPPEQQPRISNDVCGVHANVTYVTQQAVYSEFCKLKVFARTACPGGTSFPSHQLRSSIVFRIDASYNQHVICSGLFKSFFLTTATENQPSPSRAMIAPITSTQNSSIARPQEEKKMTHEQEPPPLSSTDIGELWRLP